MATYTNSKQKVKTLAIYPMDLAILRGELLYSGRFLVVMVFAVAAAVVRNVLSHNEEKKKKKEETPPRPVQWTL